MIRCHEAAELIPLHVGDDLPAEDARRIEEHLESCALCGAEYDSYAAARDRILDLRDEMPARGSLWAGVARGLDEQPAAAAAPVLRARRVGWTLWGGAAVAASLMAFFLPPMLRDRAVAPSEGAPVATGDTQLVQPTTQAELQAFLMRSATFLSPASHTEPGAEPAEPGAEAPLATPASDRPLRRY